MSLSSTTFDTSHPVLRAPSRLFLFGLHQAPDGQTRSAAAIGLLDSVSLDIAHVYAAGSFGVWNNVCSATRAGVRWLLFLNPNGSAATGTINGDLGFVQAQSYPPGTFSSDWHGAAVDGNGELLLTRGAVGGHTDIGFAQVDPDGTLIVWWESQVALDYPDRLLGLPTSHAWLNTGIGAQPTSTVSLVHRGSVVGSRTWNESWTGMAVHGDLLVLYRGTRQFPIPGGTQTTPPHYEMCRVDADHQITTLWSYEDFPATIADAEGFDITTPTRHPLLHVLDRGRRGRDPRADRQPLSPDRGHRRVRPGGPRCAEPSGVASRRPVLRRQWAEPRSPGPCPSRRSPGNNAAASATKIKQWPAARPRVTRPVGRSTSCWSGRPARP